MVGDGICDIACNVTECLYDELDCAVTPKAERPCAEGCPRGIIGNGLCNYACNVEECDYDEGDCQFPNE